MIVVTNSALSDLQESDLELQRPRATLVEIAADKLREFILLEKHPPGATISERDVAAALGISRTPLEQDGLVEYSVTRRPRVADPSLEEVAENLVVMGALEALGGELACVNATDEEVKNIVSLQQKMAAGADTLEPLDFFRTDMKRMPATMHVCGVHASSHRAAATGASRHSPNMQPSSMR